MASFSVTGDLQDDYWLVDGRNNFSILPANTINGWTIDLPIRLHIGRKESFGQLHMEKHRQEFQGSQKRSIAELLWGRLGEGGLIFDTDKINKKKIQFKQKTAALIFIERRFRNLPNGLRDEYLSMVTFYSPKSRQIQHSSDAIRYDGNNRRLSIQQAVLAEKQKTQYD